MSRQQLIEMTARALMHPEGIVTLKSVEDILKRLISFTEVESDAEVELGIDPVNTMALRWCKVLTGEARVENVKDMLLVYLGRDGSKVVYTTRDEALDGLLEMVKEHRKA